MRRVFANVRLQVKVRIGRADVWGGMKAASGLAANTGKAANAGGKIPPDGGQ